MTLEHRYTTSIYGFKNGNNISAVFILLTGKLLVIFLVWKLQIY